MGSINRARGAAGALWPLTIIGLVFGAIIGFAAVGLSSGSVTASALVRIGQPVDPTQVMTGQTASSDSTAGYVSGEIAYLADPGFSRSVGERLGRTVTVTAVQNAQSPTITFSATEPSAADADETVSTAIQTYRDHVASQNAARGNAALAALNAVISDLREQGGQSVRIEQLDLQRTAIAVQTRRDPDVQILQDPVDSTESATSKLLPAVGGALAGALIGLVVSLAWRRISGTIGSRDAVDEEFTSVLRPTVRLDRKSITSSQGAPDIATGRSLLAQLHITSDSPAHVAVIGSSASSRSDVVAGLLTSAASEHPGAVTVTDVGSSGESTSLMSVIESATHVVTVVNIGIDTLEAARLAAAVSTGTPAAQSVVCTRGSWWRAAGPTSAPTVSSTAASVSSASTAEAAVDGAPASDAVDSVETPTTDDTDTDTDTDTEPSQNASPESCDVEASEGDPADLAPSGASDHGTR